MTLTEGFNRGRSYEFGPDTAVRSWVATEKYCGPELAGLFGQAGAFLEAHWLVLRNSNRLAHFRPQHRPPLPLPPSVYFVPGYMYEQWSLRFDSGHFHTFLESCADAVVDGEPLAGRLDWHVCDDPKRSANSWSRAGASRVRRAWQSAAADADRRTAKNFTWCYQAGPRAGIRSPIVYLRDGGTRIWCEMGSRASTIATDRYMEVPWGGMRHTAAVAHSTAVHIGQMIRELERIIAGL